jgi:hypothetical protein
MRWISLIFWIVICFAVAGVGEARIVRYLSAGTRGIESWGDSDTIAGSHLSQGVSLCGALGRVEPLFMR